MANILQVTNPSLNADRNIVNTPDTALHPGKDPALQNPVDPTRVVRADGREDGRTNTAGEGRYSIIDYESNYGAFIQRLGDGAELSSLVEGLLLTGGMQELFAGDEAVGTLVDQLFSAVQMDSKEELLQFLESQIAGQTKFSGAFFDSLRGLLSGSASDSTKELALLFLKAYNDYSAGTHLLEQMHTLTEDINSLMLRSFRGEFKQLVDQMNWDAQNGDTEANAACLNSQLIPFLSKYVARTHDYGVVRDAVMHFILHAVKYENGSEDRLLSLFQRLTGTRDAARFFKNAPQTELFKLLEQVRGRKELLPEQAGQLEGKEASALSLRSGSSFADTFSELLLKGANGHAGLENIQQFYRILDGMLLNESVYLPLIHVLVPFRYQEKEVMSEMWVDPDADREENPEERRVKMLLRFDIHSLGRFELALSMQARSVEMQLYVPERLLEKQSSIQEQITKIFKANGLGVRKLFVREKTGDLKLEEVFGEIRRKESTINVRI